MFLMEMDDISVPPDLQEVLKKMRDADLHKAVAFHAAHIKAVSEEIKSRAKGEDLDSKFRAFTDSLPKTDGPE